MQKIKKCKKRKKHASPGVTAKSTPAPSALPRMPEMTKKVGSASDAGFIQLIKEVLNFREEGGGERETSDNNSSLFWTSLFQCQHKIVHKKNAANRLWCSRFYLFCGNHLFNPFWHFLCYR